MNRWRMSFISTLMFLPWVGVSAQQEDQAEKALAAVISAHERLSRELDPISAGQEGDAIQAQSKIGQPADSDLQAQVFGQSPDHSSQHIKPKSSTG